MEEKKTLSIMSTIGVAANVSAKRAGKKGDKKGKVRLGTKAGLVFPVGRLKTYMKRDRVAPRISVKGAIALGAVLEALVADVLEGANQVREATGDLYGAGRRSRITPRMIVVSALNDTELADLFRGVTIARGGVLPKPEFFIRKTGKKTAEKAAEA